MDDVPPGVLTCPYGIPKDPEAGGAPEVAIDAPTPLNPTGDPSLVPTDSKEIVS